MSRIQKHARELAIRVKALGVDSVDMDYHRGHYKLIATKGQVSIQATVAGSPGDETNCINLTLRDVRRRFHERGVQLAQ